MRQTVARAGDEVVERVIGIEQEWLIAFVEDAAAGKVIAMKADSDQSAGQRLSCGRERLLTLALAEIQLSGRRDGNLDDAVGELPRAHLIEPGAIKSWMLQPHGLQDALPDRLIENRRFDGATGRR